MNILNRSGPAANPRLDPILWIPMAVVIFVELYSLAIFRLGGWYNVDPMEMSRKPNSIVMKPLEFGIINDPRTVTAKLAVRVWEGYRSETIPAGMYMRTFNSLGMLESKLNCTKLIPNSSWKGRSNTGRRNV